ncbi:MAG: nitrile hydratase subunit beta [Halopenitus sp.]
MDGIHDVGGMDGFGSLPPDEPDGRSPFHHGWEGRVQAAYVAGLGNDVFNLDEFRDQLERQPPTYYLDTPYYERWLTGISELFVDAGVIDREELAERTAAIEADGTDPAADTTDPAADVDGGPSLEDLVDGVIETYQSGREEQEPTFDVGDEVYVPKEHPEHHTRCPRYVRGVVGEVTAHRGTHVLPDASARGEDVAEPLYNVSFDAADLWGEEHTDANAVRIELWESYVEPADNHE